jgi:hypothetical protein
MLQSLALVSELSHRLVVVRLHDFVLGLVILHGFALDLGWLILGNLPLVPEILCLCCIVRQHLYW